MTCADAELIKVRIIRAHIALLRESASRAGTTSMSAYRFPSITLVAYPAILALTCVVVTFHRISDTFDAVAS